MATEANKALAADSGKPQKPVNPYIISKRTPTQFSSKIAPIVNETTDCVFIASGNLVNVYSLTTNILIPTLRSKRQQVQSQQQQQNVAKGDVHKGNIVAMTLFQNENKLITLCSRGVLAEWNVQATNPYLIDVYELRSLGKIKYAAMNSEQIAIYDSKQQVFKVFDAKTKSLLLTLKEVEDHFVGIVNGLQLQDKTLAYIKGRNLVIHDISIEKGGKPRVIQRDALLRTLSINHDSSIIALGDDFGKIYLVHLGKQIVVQTLHWHAQRVNTLLFVPNSPYLLSGGEEAVIVQWHLETQSKNFISRLGASILNIGLSNQSQAYYAVNLDDNSVKVVRFDNNKVKVHIQSVQIDQNEDNIFFNQGSIIVPHQNKLQFFNNDERTIQSLIVKPRNYVSKGDNQEPPATQIKSFCLTPDQKNLITFEELVDKNSHKEFRFQTLKFWRREAVEDDVSNFEIIWVVHDPCQDAEKGIMLEAINNNQVLVINGSRIQLLTITDDKKWSIRAEFDYQALDVVQCFSNVKIRLQLQKQKRKSFVFLHKYGNISIWDQDTLELIHAFKLNSPSKKIVFESSMRFLASLTEAGGVEVWKIKGKQEKHQWDLNFKSIKDVINNTSKENQFIITMNSTDSKEVMTDSILLFQYSRPQNLIMYWKSQLPFTRVVFCDQSQDLAATSSYALIINKNLELQKIYFGVTRDDLKNIAQKRRTSMEIKLKESDNIKESLIKADFKFIDSKAHMGDSLLVERRNQMHLQDAQVKRLDKVDRLLRDDQAQGADTFLGMASLTFYFEQFAQEMLSKPRKAVTLIDLQEEITKAQAQSSMNQEDAVMKGSDSRADKNTLIKQVQADVERAFENLFV